ncbi:basic proline-rich protein-like [Haliotis asinina]|uniref:basic proline-rich protein-like n=1 Tax=Haliotis asinina TaxID=109174 RepID=UPI003531F881
MQAAKPVLEPPVWLPVTPTHKGPVNKDNRPRSAELSESAYLWFTEKPGCRDPVVSTAEAGTPDALSGTEAGGKAGAREPPVRLPVTPTHKGPVNKDNRPRRAEMSESAYPWLIEEPGCRDPVGSAAEAGTPDALSGTEAGGKAGAREPPVRLPVTPTHKGPVNKDNRPRRAEMSESAYPWLIEEPGCRDPVGSAAEAGTPDALSGTEAGGKAGAREPPVRLPVTNGTRPDGPAPASGIAPEPVLGAKPLEPAGKTTPEP